LEVTIEERDVAQKKVRVLEQDKELLMKHNARLIEMRDRAESSRVRILERERDKAIAARSEMGAEAYRYRSERDDALGKMDALQSRACAAEERQRELERELIAARVAADPTLDRGIDALKRGMMIYGYKYDEIVEILGGHAWMKARVDKLGCERNEALLAARRLRCWVALTGEPIQSDILKKTAWIDEAQP
jgi:hypothetical protein